MKTIFEPSREIPILADTDVLVVGGGPAGLAAAIASARQGAKTTLMERYGCFGGVLTQAGVEAIAWYRHKNTVEAGGLLTEIEKIAVEMGAAVKECQSDSYAINTELFKIACDDMITKAGVRPLLHCSAANVIVENGTLKGVITESKSGRLAVLAKQVVDCTGDADIAMLAGAPFHKSEKENLMLVTQVFCCNGVDAERFLRYVHNELKPTYRDWAGGTWNEQASEEAAGMFSPYMDKIFIDAIKDGRLVPNDKNVGFGGTWSTVTPEGDITQLNIVSVRNIDCTDVLDLTRAEMLSRRACLQALELMKKEIPGFENAKLRNFGMTIGTRESRLIKGRYTITKQDVFEQGRFEDSIAIFPEFGDGQQYLVLPLTGRYYQIPYRALVPQNIDNLLVAGRCISGDPVAHTSFRNISCCVATGQAAGTAAAVALRENTTTSAIDFRKVQNSLISQGVRIF